MSVQGHLTASCCRVLGATCPTCRQAAPCSPSPRIPLHVVDVGGHSGDHPTHGKHQDLPSSKPARVAVTITVQVVQAGVGRLACTACDARERVASLDGVLVGRGADGGSRAARAPADAVVLGRVLADLVRDELVAPLLLELAGPLGTRVPRFDVFRRSFPAETCSTQVHPAPGLPVQAARPPERRGRSTRTARPWQPERGPGGGTVDTGDLKSPSPWGVRVQLPPRALAGSSIRMLPGRSGACTIATAAVRLLPPRRPVTYPAWGCSSTGRALEWHSRGRGFESHQLHSSSS